MSSWSKNNRIFVIVLLLTTAWLISSCRAGSEQAGASASEQAKTVDESHQDELQKLNLPELEPAELDGGRLRVVATTSIIGDVASQIGGDVIDLMTLMEPGQDPHSYEPTAADLTHAADAHLILVNGWDLEEGLIDDLANVAENAVMVPLSANIVPLAFGQNVQMGSENHDGQADPHAWLDPHLVRQWVLNLEEVLAQMDPDNADFYQDHSQTYLAELDQLIEYYDEAVATIPAEGRKVVTNHDSFAYFAEQYDFSIIGTVVPAASTLAEPSATELAELVQIMEREEVCTIFSESTANDRLAAAVAAELPGCEQVKIISLYTGALGVSGSPADNYLGMMRANIDAISAAIR
jgi:ABC-type Zn uptake system ZnuABC Zn-binding protein ZnuA